MKLRRSIPNSQCAEVATSDLPGRFRQLHVVVLINYLRPHHVVCFQELARRVGKLTILISIPMEPNRDWEATWAELDVRVQKNWMFTTRWRHSLGFEEPNFIHVPVDTCAQLKKLKPDIVFSYEMGFRTLLSCWFRTCYRRIPLVMVGNMSEHIETERSLLRRAIRRLISWRADYMTYNGPSCKRYLERYRNSSDNLFHLPYCIDPEVVYEGEPTEPTPHVRRLLFCGSLTPRKGILKFLEVTRLWCEQNPEFEIEFSVAGDGPQKSSVEGQGCANLKIRMLGNCDTERLRSEYGRTDCVVFPSLADEWGLVPIEAMASGVPVLGSQFAQSVEAVIRDGENGWSYRPVNVGELTRKLDQVMRTAPHLLKTMGERARNSVAHINPRTTADRFCDIIDHALFEPQEKSDAPNSEPMIGGGETAAATNPGSKNICLRALPAMRRVVPRVVE